MATKISLTPKEEKLVLNSRYTQHLGKDVYLSDSYFNGQVYIHVRKLKHKKVPTKDGISLTLPRCNELFMSLPFLDDAVTLMEQNQETFYGRHMGGNWHVAVDSGCVDIRQFWLPMDTNEIRASRNGISLMLEQYKEITNGLRILDSFVPELRDVVTCYTNPHHDEKACTECTPV